jgi:AcrR family transcriptional regulator
VHLHRALTLDTDAAPRTRYRKGEGDKLRTDLLDAAADLLAAHGDLDSVSLRAVARRAGVSPTAVYRHFDDHVELLNDAVEHCWTTFYEHLRSADVTSDDPFVAFRAMGDAYVDYALTHPGQYRVLFSGKVGLGDGSSPGGLAAFRLLVDAVARILTAVDDPRDPFFVAVQVHTWIHGMVELRGSHPDMVWPEMSDLLDALAEALGLRPTT